MQIGVFNVVAVLSGLAVVFANDICTAPSLTVKTDQGEVKGFRDESSNVAQFLGIPYGEQLRWSPAIPKGKFGKLNATSFGPNCPQSEPAATGPWAPEFLIKPNSTSENCLFLNVWAPSHALCPETEPLPVIVWIHGGGFVEGGGGIAYQIPKKWVERSQKHIVVSINYRLGVFGFPNAPSLGPKQQNLGLLDQRLAMQWVNDNISRFGGDPKRIILWGQSAGAMSVAFYQYAYPKTPIAAGYIENSGSAFLGLRNRDDTNSNFTSLARSFGCRRDYVECLRRVPWKDVQRHVDEAKTMSFVPVVDERTVFSNYTERILNVTKLPAIIGSTRDEGDLTAKPEHTGANTPDQVKPDDTFHCPAHYETIVRSSAGVNTWRYMYSPNFTNIMPGGEGAFHSAELPLIMGTHDEAREKSSEFEYEVSHAMQDCWLAFAQDPSAGLTRMGWEPTPKRGVQSGIEFGFKNEIVVRPYSWSSLEKGCNKAAAVKNSA
ncbi:Alpha/Beta hydrolase protein [Fusarium flagelliforme]|uniref:Carboxylic ester hydrolase n=1 Tax=Fusarium flagelliforme TaxID=2675880 RepID=A0A395M921_9HYPO|nr:Alpha/Beta hydrolase protein [Fusarium flagelliforme]KAH7198538.1 Alpha/Beta hydrolase protein [Fusarium flagelliforme]RFN43773.1 hypothetical protein FIE12Z_11981 [Fusarium flagelliforme]